ncbi:hypothetical protein CJ014_00875 [Pleomorphomonas carboxyditropha]|uniref:Uncharacterized protein n=2 Tax=Pleomorphomonas carboxyditropha TaxID=2023338 RepID=A0A2G9X177_9HYPH|nr:hypothetical protein CJ014_00875 [Pleomorphomonas carboxyditropha]
MLFEKFGAALAGKKPDMTEFTEEFVRPEYVEEALDEMMHIIAEEVDTLPERLGLNFVETEAIRALDDQMLMRISGAVNEAVRKMYGLD